MRDNIIDRWAYSLTSIAIFCCLVLFWSQLLVPFLPLAHATNEATISSQVFPPDSKPFGLTYGEWSAKWWQWALSIPKEKSPFIDETGKNCGEGQNDPNVFFLAGTLGGPAKRTCTITSDKAIFFPIINIEADLLHTPETKTVEELKKFTKGDQDSVTHLSAEIDGLKLTDLDRYRVQSPVFNLTYPANNIYGVNSGIPTIAMSDGTWIMLKPLSPGEHDVRFTGVLVDFTVTTPENFVTDITYNLTVLP